MSQILNNVLALPGAFLLGLCLLAKFVTPTVRRTVGRKVYDIAYRQHQGVAQLQKRLRHPLLDILCKATALTVSVEFYLLALPPLVWLGGPPGLIACLALCQCMAVSTYMTCVLKDMLSCPRPYTFVRQYGGAATAKQLPPPPSLSSSLSPLHATATATIHADTAVAAAASISPLPRADGGDGGDGYAEGSFSLFAAAAIAAVVPQPDSITNGDPAVAATRIATSPRHHRHRHHHHEDNVALGSVDQEVAVLEDAYRGEIEYGAPSMHTWCALVLPSYSAAVAHQLGGLSAAQCAAVTAAAGCWATWVALTRLYLGVHTPVDLLLGALGGGAVWGLWRRMGLMQVAAVGAAMPEAVTATAVAAGAVLPLPSPPAAWAWIPSWLGFGGDGSGGGKQLAALAAIGLLYVGALRSYPVPESHTTSYEYAVIFLGAAYGALVSANSNCSLTISLLQRIFSFSSSYGSISQAGSEPPAAQADVVTRVDGAAAAAGATIATVTEFLTAEAPPVLRQPVAVLLLGFVFVFAVKLLSKALLSKVLPRLLDLAPLRLRLLWRPPVHPSGDCAAAMITQHGHGAQARSVAGNVQQARAEQMEGTVMQPAAGAVSPAAVPAASLAGDSTSGVRRGVLMKTSTLPYDVDFLRKFLNYGITVYAAMEYRHVAEALMLMDPAAGAGAGAGGARL